MNHPNSTPSSFRSKLSSYATGLAIGCILMGFFFYQKSKATQRAHQNQTQQLQPQQLQPQQLQQDSNTPPAEQQP